MLKPFTLFFLSLKLFNSLLYCGTALAITPEPYQAKFKVLMNYRGESELTDTSEDKLLSENLMIDSFTRSDLGYSQRWNQYIGTAELNVCSNSFTLTLHSSLDRVKPSKDLHTAENIHSIEILMKRICKEEYIDKDNLKNSFSTFTYFLCPLESGELIHHGKFDGRQVTTIKTKGLSFQILESVEGNKLNVSQYFTPTSKVRKRTKVQLITTTNNLLIYPELFISGQLLTGLVESGDSVNVAANLLTSGLAYYLPCYFNQTPDKLISIPAKNGGNETHFIRGLQFTFRIDDESDKNFIIDSLSADIFTSDKLKGQVYKLKFSIYLINLGIKGSGYIEVIYEREFETQEKNRLTLKRFSADKVEEDEGTIKNVRLGRFRTTTTTGNITPLLSDPSYYTCASQSIQETAAHLI